MSTLSPPVVQLPSTLWVPERLGTYGDVVNGFASDIGIPRDLVQQRDIDCLASYGIHGRWLTLETCLVEGRQNGKTKAVMLSLAMADLFLGFGGPGRVIWTAHLMSTTLDTFEAVKKLIESNSSLSRRVKEINETKTQEGVVLHDGSEIRFMARAGGAGRGFDGKRLIFDEALFLAAASMGALIPTLSSKDNPQINYGSSAGKGESDQLRALQARGRRGNDPSLILIEYKAPGGWDDPRCGRGILCDHIYENPLNDVRDPETGYVGCAMDNPDNWKMANHAVGVGRMRLEFIAAESRALRQTPEGVLEFGRERMGWTELGGVSLDPDRIPESLWEARADPQSRIVGPVCFAIDAPPSMSHVAISVAGRREDNKIHFGTIVYERGSSWAARKLSQLLEKHETICAPIWQPEAPIRALRTDFETEKLTLRDMTYREYADACGAFKQHIINGTAFHRGTRYLDDAFKSAERKVLPEGGWSYGRRKSTGDISPFVSAIMAVKGVDDYGDGAPSVYVV